MFLTTAFALLSALPAPLTSLQSSFKSVKAFEVNFEQSIQQDLFPEVPEKASGRLMFSRPKTMSWTYEKPKLRKIQFNGTELTIDENGEKQVIREQGRLTIEKAFAFLWGEPDLQIFKIEPKSGSSFLVKPIEKDSVSFESIEVSVSNGRVSQVKVKDRLGGGSQIKFSDWKLTR